MYSFLSGIDLVEVARLVELKDNIRRKFLERVYTQVELDSAGDSNERLAEFFAAKEAVTKALGSGIGAVGWRDIEVHVEEISFSSVYLHLHNEAQQLSDRLNVSRWFISLSHTHKYALALVIGTIE